MRQYGVALYGLGRIAWRGFGKPHIETHATEILAHPRLKLLAGIDTDANARIDFQARFGVTVSDSPVRAPIAVICTPPEAHAQSVLAAISNGARGILCEKPLAPTHAQSLALVEACRMADIPLLVGHQRRYDSEHRLLRELGVKHVAVEFSGSWLNNGTHAADIARFICPGSFSLSQVENECFVVRAGLVKSLSSRGYLAPGYLHRMYDDLIECIETGKRPECSGDDGAEAVRIALEEEAKCQQKTGDLTQATGSASQMAARSVSVSNVSWSEPIASRTREC